MAVVNDAASADAVRARLDRCLRVLEQFQWLLDCYVLDFFVDDHWSRIPASWRDALAKMTPAALAKWLDYDGEDLDVLPLTLLSLRASVLVDKGIIKCACVKNLNLGHGHLYFRL